MLCAMSLIYSICEAVIVSFKALLPVLIIAPFASILELFIRVVTINFSQCLSFVRIKNRRFCAESPA